jgi:hypothetical protein
MGRGEAAWQRCYDMGQWCKLPSVHTLLHHLLCLVTGITYQGAWSDGKYHGRGAKLYSRGGGYAGDWVQGRREGQGAHLFAGKFGYDKWEGSFVGDQPHGEGVMHYVGGSQALKKQSQPIPIIFPLEGAFVFEHGKPLTLQGDQYDGEAQIDDGSPSTVGQPGRYKGGWKEGRQRFRLDTPPALADPDPPAGLKDSA